MNNAENLMKTAPYSSFKNDATKENRRGPEMGKLSESVNELVNESIVSLRKPLSNLPDNFPIIRKKPTHQLPRNPLKAIVSISSGTKRGNLQRQTVIKHQRSKSASTVTDNAPSLEHGGSKRKIDDHHHHGQKVAKFDTKITVRAEPRAIIKSDTNTVADEEVFVDAREFFSLSSESSDQSEKVEVPFRRFDEAKLSTSKSEIVETFPIVCNDHRQSAAGQPRKQKTNLVRKLSNRYNRTNIETYFGKCMYSIDYFVANYRYMLEREDKFVIRKKYLAHVDAYSRPVTVNWMIYAQQYFNLGDPTFLSSVLIFDQMLSHKLDEGSGTHYHLIAATSLWVANKFLDTQLISLTKIFALCDGKYTRQQIKEMEIDILKNMDFDLNVVEPQTFLFYFMRNENLHGNMKLFYTAEFLLESFTLLIHYSSTHPSLLACCALYSALVKLQIDEKSFVKFVNSHLLDEQSFKKFAGEFENMAKAVLQCHIVCNHLIKKYSTLQTHNVAADFLPHST